MAKLKSASTTEFSWPWCETIHIWQICISWKCYHAATPGLSKDQTFYCIFWHPSPNLPSFKLIFLASFYKIVNLKISTPVVPTTRDNVFHIHCTEKKSHPMVVVSLYHTTPMVQHNPAHSNDTFCKVHLKLHIHCKYSPMHLFQIINFDQTPVYVMYKNSYWRTPHSWNGLWKTFFLSSSFFLALLCCLRWCGGW